MRFFNHVRTNDRRQRGFVLVTALVLAILYFSLMQLLLIDTSRAMAEAQRFRSRVVAATLAENGAELAALRIVDRTAATAESTDFQGSVQGRLTRNGENFELTGEGTARGVLTQQATVRVIGRIKPGGTISIDYTMHGQ